MTWQGGFPLDSPRRGGAGSRAESFGMVGDVVRIDGLGRLFSAVAGCARESDYNVRLVFLQVSMILAGEGA